MPVEHEPTLRRIHNYVHSTTFRITSWSGLALILLSFFIEQNRYIVLGTGIVLSVAATMPLLAKLPFDRQLNLSTKRDKRMVVFVAAYVFALVIMVLLVTLYSR